MSRRKIKCPSCKEWLHINWNKKYKWEIFNCPLCEQKFKVYFNIDLRIPKVIKKEILNNEVQK